MTWPQMPLPLIIFIPIAFIIIVLFTNIRYALRPDDYIGNSTVFASLVIGFIFLYAMQKYDLMDLNVETVSRNLFYLSSVAEKYNPSSICYLIRYAKGFLNFEKGDFSLLRFEKKILPQITDEATRFRVQESITILEQIYNQRISQVNLIAEPLWYLTFITAILLTIIFPLDISFAKRSDSVIVIILIWLPILTIYYLYISELESLEKVMTTTIDCLEKLYRKSKNTTRNSQDEKESSYTII